MRLKIDATLDYFFEERAEVLLALEVAQMPDQRLISDRLIVGTSTPLTPVAGQQGIGRRVWTAGEGTFQVSYEATVDVTRGKPDLSGIKARPLPTLPGRVVHYLWPSRYCHVEDFKDFAVEEFGHLEGGRQILAIAEWTASNISYTPGVSDALTTAFDTYQRRQGICRDYAHVMVSIVRALSIPARIVSAYAWNLQPPDFHAVVEVYLDGGWYLVDPSGLAPVDGLVRIGVGRDAADISFLTVFGSADLKHQFVNVQRLD